MADNFYLSKTDFVRKFLVCPAYLWISKYQPEVVPEEDLTRIFAQGNLVEEYARKLFPNGTMVEAAGKAAAPETQKLIEAGKTTLFQATVHTEDGLLAKADIVTNNDDDSWTIHEVKSSTKVKPDHLVDLAFQQNAFEKAGYRISQLNVIHINNQYVRDGEVTHEGLFTPTDVTKRVAKLYEETNRQIKEALDVLKLEKCPECLCNRRAYHCPTFHHFHPDVPEYSVFDISKLGGRILEELADQKRYKIEDLPDEIKLTDRQHNQVVVVKTGKPIIETDTIRSILDKLEHPLYFLDYETTWGALPTADGWKPYQSMPFQFSLHRLDEDGRLTHHECLATIDDNVPSLKVLERLKESIGDTGTIIVWNKGFEVACNNAMKNLHPEYGELLDGINARVFDLMDIFKAQHYVHQGFRGSNSIKDILPVIEPEMSHSNLAVQAGQDASALWEETLNSKMAAADRQKIYADLREYCQLDTLAMVKIYQHLREICDRVAA